MAAGDLTTLSDVKAWMNLSGSGDDALLTRLITAASTFIQSWLNRQIASQAYTDTLNGNGSRVMVLANYPVTAVASVSVDGVAIAAAANAQSTGYLFDTNAVYLNGSRFRRDLQNVVISYTAGYATVPFDIAQACIELISMRYKERTRIGEQSKQIGTETISFSIKDMSDSTKTALSQYRRVVPV